ncbi:MAG: ABC transporter permease [Deltaproteobacteria bacterium]|nr:ABC transporter permease [Deltaproteobacteria bacterium]MBW2122151.1 ABC transporter permease [Deltaproteobacteria bacterium]
MQPARILGGGFYRHPQVCYALLAGAAGLFVAAFFGYPLFGILKLAMFHKGFTTSYFREIFQDPEGYYFRVFFTTFRVAGTVTLLTLILGYPMAGLLLHAREKWQKILMICIILPFWTSVLVRTYAWMILLGRRGVVNFLLIELGLTDGPVQLLFNTTGTIIGMTHIMLPYMIFPLYSVMRNIDPRLTAAAYTLGARPWQTFLRVFFPLSLPGVMGGGLLVFIISLGFFITPALMGGQKDLMIAVLIERRVMELLQWGLSAALSLVLLAATLLLVMMVQKFMKVEALFGGR